MAKQKTKKSAWDTECTEVEPGVWQWMTEGFTWRRHEKMGINTEVSDDGRNFQPLIFTRNLNDAVMYAHGFRSGYAAKTRESV